MNTSQINEALLEACANFATPPTTIEALIKEGANIAHVDEKGFTPLHLAAKFSLQPRLIDILLKNGADTEARTNSGSTPLILAVAVNIHPGFTDILINHNADVNAKDNGGWSPIDFAVSHPNISSREERFEALKKALHPSTGAFEINCIDPEASLGDTIRKLIKAGANIESTPEDGFTPIIRAAAQSQPIETFEALLEHNPNLSAQLPSKHHVIHYVAASCPREILNTLNQHDPSSVKSLLEEKTDEGFTPILLAAANNSINCIDGLMDLNASPLALTFDERNILDLAKSNEKLSDDDRDKVEQYHTDYVKTMAFD